MIDLTYEIKEHEKNIKRKTLTIKELAQTLGIGENKARQLTHAKGFPVIVFGRKRLTVIAKLDTWLEEYIGQEFDI